MAKLTRTAAKAAKPKPSRAANGLRPAKPATKPASKPTSKPASKQAGKQAGKPVGKPAVHSAKPAAAAATPKIPPPPARVPSPYVGRLERLAALVHRMGSDHLLVSNPVDVGYLTGFLGGDTYLILGPGLGTKRCVLVSDGRYDEELNPARSFATVILRKKGLLETVADLCRDHGVGKLAIQAEHMTVADASVLRAVVVGAVEIFETPKLVEKLRVIKDAHECDLMEKAIRLQEAAMKAVMPKIVPGRTELEIAADLESEMKYRGSSHSWFAPIVGVGANAALPHYRPGMTKVRRNEIILIDWGSTWQGYGGDMTRVFALGKWPAKMREVYEIVREAQEASAAALAPGKSTHEVDRVARDIITKAGYGAEFNHGLGHGLGMSKEPPYLNPLYAPIPLEVGHVCTIEPGIYLPGVGGVRIEDQYVLTPTGSRNFCKLPKTLAFSTL